MSLFISSLWEKSSSDFASGIEACVNAVCDSLGPKKSCAVFFRADDAGVPGKQFTRLIKLFTRYRVPLSLAVVPAWLTRSRWNQIQKPGNKYPSLWHWHQHGWRHKNHEKKGKKQEFGPGRFRDDIRNDLLRGRNRLEDIMGKAFSPVFTPPWNRCDMKTLNLLKEMRYHAVSGNTGSFPKVPAGLPDCSVHVDLHTRKSTKPAADLRDLFSELKKCLSTGGCGIMIHHQCMNDNAFYFMELLLKKLTSAENINIISMKDLL